MKSIEELKELLVLMGDVLTDEQKEAIKKEIKERTIAEAFGEEGETKCM